MAARGSPRQHIFGTWNWLVVQLSQWMPGVGDHYLARSGVNSQKADIEIEADRPDDLFAPVDDDEDHGSHGIFDDVAGGVLQPKFLRSLPKTLLDLLRSIRARIVEVRARRTGP